MPCSVTYLPLKTHHTPSPSACLEVKKLMYRGYEEPLATLAFQYYTANGAVDALNEYSFHEVRRAQWERRWEDRYVRLMETKRDNIPQPVAGRPGGKRAFRRAVCDPDRHRCVVQ
ncbi:hypothetical protein ABW19_dt0201488 [Dactylella cylindrospora]|nr:hypothetical protein ABW19_dt0201488 [Dactylella cylindrospora]